jgi:diguanylate cyclase (GGDEF)-like protein
MLIVSTEEWVALSVETLFAPRGYAVARAATRNQAQDLVSKLPPDLIVISRDLRDARGIDLCEWLQQHGGDNVRVTPKLLLGTSPWTREERLAALQAGAWDVFHVPTDGEELFARVNTWVEAKLTCDVVRERGLLDPNTGFYNAQGLLRRMEELGAGAGRHNRPLACVIIAADLSDDEALLADEPRDALHGIAERLRTSRRASDSIGRVSANEFVVVAPDTDQEGARGLVNRLRRVMESTGPRGPSVRFGAFAVPHFRDASIAPAEMLIRAADALRLGDDYTSGDHIH